MTAVEEAVEDLADLYLAERAARGTSKPLIRRVAARRARSVSRGVPKASAARLLGVSPNTLNKWIGRGRIKVMSDPRSGRELVNPTQLALLLANTRSLRDLGQRDGVLASAIAQIERADPRYQHDFDELYGQSLASMTRGDLKPLVLPDGFGPQD